MSEPSERGKGRLTAWVVVAVLAGGLALAGGVWWWMRPAAPADAPLQLTLVAAERQGDFARALEPRPFDFPADHGPHPEFQIEWWYYTGNLQDQEGRRFAYQLTFFRRALSPGTRTPGSGLGADQIYFAHLALIDAEARDHRHSQRFSRAAAGLAGAQGDPFHVWLEDWSAEALNESGSRVRLRAVDPVGELDLTLEAEKPIVAHGDDGLSAKSVEPGNASYYLSYTRMRTEGELTLDGELFQVTGSSWFDHEWSTSALGPDEVGWDWFSLQLSDGSELMYYRLRREDGSAGPASSGTLVQPDGSTVAFGWEEVELEELDRWTSPDSGAAYPSGWRLRLPSLGLDVTIEPFFEAQEMNVNVVYWEGAVRVAGERRGQALSGYGFVELTGYAESIQGSF